MSHITKTPAGQSAKLAAVGGLVGWYRWVVCAMLFCATTIK
jgi:hypothetical protein